MSVVYKHFVNAGAIPIPLWYVRMATLEISRMKLGLVSVTRFSHTPTFRKALGIMICFVFGLFSLERSLVASEHPSLHPPLELFDLEEEGVNDGQSQTKSLTSDPQDEENNRLKNAVHLYPDSSFVSYSEDELEENPRLLSNIRPFKRARERWNKEHTLIPPAPPSVETLDLKKSEELHPAESPVLSLASATLPPINPSEALKENEELVTKADLEELRAETKGFSWSKGNLKITPYGFLNLSVSSDTQRAIPGEFILYLQDPSVDSSSDFTLDARSTRLGAKFEGPRIEALHGTLGGIVEFDFQGMANGPKNKGGVQLRCAYAEIVDKENERRILCGQDWEIVSPLAPRLLNYLPCVLSGNIGFRRAQLRYEQGWTVSPNLHFLGQIAICDNPLGDFLSTSGVTGSSSGWPIIEGRISADLFKEARDGMPITVGLSGHMGEQYYKFSSIAGVPSAATTEKKAIKTWSTNLDYTMPITKTLTFQGEYFIGSNLSSLGGGINQGVDLYRREGIDSQGWWACLQKKWNDKLVTHVGHGIDSPEEKDLWGVTVASNGMASSRTRNENYFVNALYNWTENFMTGIEFSYWETDYQKKDVTSAFPTTVSTSTAKALRTEFTTRLSF